MENQNDPINERQRDLALPLFLTGITVAIICAVLCVVLYLSRDFINNDLAPALGLVEPTPVPIVCPSVPTGWTTLINENFDYNQYDWSTGKETDEYADKNVQIMDGLLRLNIKAKKGVFSYYYPDNKWQPDYYLTARIRKISGPLDAEYGLVFRIQGEQKFLFSINDLGMVRVHVRDAKGNWLSPWLNEYSRYVKAGENNDLAVFEQDDHYIFCVNQNVVGEVVNSDYPYGKTGLGVD